MKQSQMKQSMKTTTIYGLFFTGTNEMVDVGMTFLCAVSAQNFVDKYAYMFDDEVSVEVKPLGEGMIAGNMYMIAGYSGIGHSKVIAG